MEFDEDVKAQLRTEIERLLGEFSLAASELTEKASKRVVWNPPTDDIQLLFNHHVDAVWASHVSKFSLLARSIIESVNAQNFLVYGLSGRSLIEHAAILRYYLSDRINPILERAIQEGTTSNQDLNQIFTMLDTLHRGSYFDWASLLKGEVENLKKRKKKDLPAQVRVGDSIRSWQEEIPSIGILYGLFSDLVHPNVGTNLLVMNQWRDGIGYGGEGGRPFGMDIFERTMPGLAMVMNRARDLLNALLLLRLPEEASQED